MFTFTLSSFLAALLFVYLFMPAVWLSIISVDGVLDAREAGLAVVAARNPFRESGPPANMAKLILLRHKIQTSTRRRRSSSHSRSSSRNTNFIHPPAHVKQVSVSRSSRAPWFRLGRGFRPFGNVKQYC
ncbi:hypothetical protein D9758_001352 [Tetrapyrgos nigripes]|uniref:Uncharacterized protein n=1 Tax=Tetrapyrgos nigripes TaxID=182062 RepID=A0A8H5GS52_9AGAR|nr:hypothetical protein D9758_001352 [Tetrapyrgos nigripes]